MALSTKTLKVLKDAGLDGADVALFSDEDLLGLPGVGPAVLADIRATYPAPTSSAVLRVDTQKIASVPADVDTVKDLAAAATRAGVSGPVATADPPAPEPAPVAPVVDPGCICDQPFKVTRTRQRAGRIERYCDACGAVQASAGGRS